MLAQERRMRRSKQIFEGVRAIGIKTIKPAATVKMARPSRAV